MRDVGGRLLATNLRLVIGTPQSRADGIRFIVEASDQLIYEGNVNSSSVVVSIPKRYQIVNSDVENRQKGIHVYTESQSEHIFVIVENFVETFTHGTFLAYPCGFEESNSFEYRIISTENIGNDQVLYHSEFLLVGCYNDTLFEIIPVQSVDLPLNFQIQNDSEPQIVTVDPGNSYHVVIHEMQTLLVLSVHDLTGTMIISNKPLTVISGHECASVPSSVVACEPFGVQIPPIAVWGNRFLLAPFAGRTGAQLFKAVSSMDDANFSYVCNNTAHIVQNHTLEINTSHYCYLETSKPAFVVQFSIGQGVDNRGDPAIAPISPIENYIHETELIILPFQANYISITVSAEHFDSGNNIKLDERNINCTWEMINNSRSTTVGYGCSIYLSSSERYTKHSVRHFQENGRLSVLVYGFRFQEPIHEGYAYLAGMTYYHPLNIASKLSTYTTAIETTESVVEVTESDTSSSFPLVYILAATIAAVTVGIFSIGVLTVCCCYCKRRKQ